MEISQYSNIIKETAVYPKEFGYGYCVLGLVGELAEFREAAAGTDQKAKIKEAGDVCWYLTALCYEHNVPLVKVLTYDSITWETTQNIDMQLNSCIGEIAEWTKKYYRDGAFPVVDTEIYMTLRNIGYFFMVRMHQEGLNLRTILETNYAKLIKRRNTGTLHGSGDNREDAH